MPNKCQISNDKNLRLNHEEHEEKTNTNSKKLNLKGSRKFSLPVEERGEVGFSFVTRLFVVRHSFILASDSCLLTSLF